MWCYKIPGFEALLLTELQRQQQCRQFCDVLLKTEGVSVPAHSCILSAISPHISAAVSSTPSPPAGQSRLLDLQSLDACSLLHMVRLMYSGEMIGEREEEKQEAISAAARLGIHGLVQVTRRVCKCRHEEGEGRRAEVGVQTEPEENERGRCRREMRDGCTFLWKETLSGGGRETWTQTEEQAGSYPAASFETIDLAALQGLRQTDTGLPHSQIPYVPMSLVYPQDENQAHQSSSATVDTMQESTAAVVAPPYTSLRPFSSPCAADPQSWCSAPQRTGGNVPAAEEWTDEHFLQFQGNIPGYINYFLNPAKEESPSRGRARKRRGARVGGARRAGTGESRARKPRASRGGRGRGGLMQTVDVQEVKEGKLQKLFLHRWGMRASRMGQGGGAAGKKLYLKTRELLKPVKKRIRRTKGLDFSPDGDVPLHSEEGAGNTQHGPKSATQQFNQRLYNNTLSASSPSLQPSSPRLLSPAPSFLHTTPIPPPAPPPPEEHFDRLLEEVMMGLDILPNNNSASHSQPPLLARSSTNASSGSTLTRNKQQGRAADLLEAGPGFHRSTQVEVTAGGSNCADSEGPILQQQREGELNEMLENLLLSFEQHADSCAATEEMEVGGQSCREVMNDEAESHAARAHSAVTVGTQEKVKKAAKQRKRKRKNEFPFSFEKKRVRKPELSSDAKTKMIHDQQEKQLQQMPVVKLERSGPLPVRVTLRGSGSHYLEVKSAMFSSSSVRCRHDKNKQVFSGLKMYPIRSRFREARMDSAPFLQKPFEYKRPFSTLQPGHMPKNNVSLCNGENPTSPIQPQPADEQHERHEEECSLPPQLEAEEPDSRGAESEEEISDDAPAAKRVCFQQMPQLTPETCTSGRESADFEPAAVEVEDVIDEMTVSLTRVEDCLQKGEREAKTAQSEIRCSADEEVESSGDEIIDVDGDVDEPEKDRCQSTTAQREKPSRSEVSLRSAGSCEEDKDNDIDVIGGSSPVPDPVTIDWTDSSEGEKEEGDEDVDVVGEKQTTPHRRCFLR